MRSGQSTSVTSGFNAIGTTPSIAESKNVEYKEELEDSDSINWQGIIAIYASNDYLLI